MLYLVFGVLLYCVCICGLWGRFSVCRGGRVGVLLVCGVVCGLLVFSVLCCCCR